MSRYSEARHGEARERNATLLAVFFAVAMVLLLKIYNAVYPKGRP